jgi:small subunit ribosomal protein S19
MARSLKKGPFVSHNLLKKIEDVRTADSEEVIVTWERNSTVVPIMIARTISVYNGREHLPIFVTDQIVGHKLGEFAPTRTFRGHSASDKKAKRLLYLLLWDKKLTW